MYKNKGLILICLLAICTQSFMAASQTIKHTNKPQVWLTDADSAIKFKLHNQSIVSISAGKNKPTIIINPTRPYQQMDGFGFALTGGSAMLIHKMNEPQQDSILQELFSTKGDAIGTSYLRVSIGSSDLDDHVFTYDDLDKGETDPELKKFDLGVDKLALIPVLKKILLINPHIKILGSPWSAPVWMKTNGSSVGGHLKPEYYHAYSQYFIKYIRQMKLNGINIDAITIQNEPLNPNNNPSMVMEAPEEAAFIKNNLGPDLQAAGFKTKIILYDHNADRPDYPISILNDPEARKYVDGSAFHLYGGKIEALSAVHDAYPDKNLYFTEEWVGAPGNLKEDIHFHIKDLIIGAPRNWCKNVLEWNLAADQNQQPHTPGGCDRCLGAITINGNEVTRNSAYYIIAHASKFVRPGCKRIDSSTIKDLPNVAFLTPAGQIVLIVYNDSKSPQVFNVKTGNKQLALTLNAGAVETIVL